VAAGNQGKFWEMHDWLYDNQEGWASLSGADARDKMTDEAKKLGLDINKFNKDVDSAKTSQLIEKTQNEGIGLGVAGTPTFYLDDKKIDPLPADYEAFKKVVSDAVASKK
jgi:protein-disulfide isomerase